MGVSVSGILVGNGVTGLAVGTRVGGVDIGASVKTMAAMGLFVGLLVTTPSEGASVSPSDTTRNSELDNADVALATVLDADTHCEPPRQLIVTEEE